MIKFRGKLYENLEWNDEQKQHIVDIIDRLDARLTELEIENKVLRNLIDNLIDMESSSDE